MSGEGASVRLLIDATPLSSGGGVQVAVAFLDHLMRQDDAGDRSVTWQAAAPDGLRAMLPERLAADTRLRFLPKRGKGDFARLAVRLPPLVRAFRPDVVFTVFGPAYFKARAPHVVGFALPNLIYERDAVLRAAAGPLAPLRDRIKGLLVRRADHHMVETETVRERLSRHLQIDENRITVIPNSVNPLLNRYKPTPLQREGIFAILVPAAYYRHKNLEILPEVAEILTKLSPDAAFEFQLTLDPGSRSLTEIMAAARARGVADRIRTLGVLRLDALAQAYKEASAVLLPTLREASTAVYPESFHFERPLVTSDMDFARELCGDAAEFCDPHNAEDYARAFARFMSDRAAGEMSGRLVEAGRRRLAFSYPPPIQKFAMQMAQLRRIAGARPSDGMLT